MQFAEETAIVSEVEGDFVLLKTQNNGSCGNCSSKSGCGNISSIFSFKPRSALKISNTLQLKEGDSVVVAMSPSNLLLATILMYLMPLLLLFLFSIVAKSIWGENASIAAGLAGLGVGLLWVKKYTQQSNVSDMFQPKLVRKVINVAVTS